MNTLSAEIKKTIKQVLTHYVITNNDKELSPLSHCVSKKMSLLNVSLLGNGLINQTYLVSFNKASNEKREEHVTEQWVLQKINKNVFPVPEHIMENAEKINQHLTLQKSHGLYPFAIANQVLTEQGEAFVKVSNEYWRVMDYIPQSFSIEAITNNEQAQQVAYSFTSFARALSDFPAHTLHTIIPNFLDINSRIEQLSNAIKRAHPKRLEYTHTLQTIPTQYQSFIREVNEMSKTLPVRAVHHDTKINNLLFSKETQNVAAVIDLDTCMPGYLMYDFGDMVRSCCATLAEDGRQLDELALDMERLKVLAKHYIKPWQSVMSPTEQKSLALGVILLPLILGIRFLTDYLNNDIYFKVNYEHHNLDRAKNQFALFQHFFSQKSCIQAILNNN